MQPALIVDVESIPDPEMPLPADHDPEKMLPIAHQKIVAIGALLFDQNYSVRSIGIIGATGTERQACQAFVDYFTKNEPRIVTFNGRGFDLPLIALRCLRYGIPFHYYYNTRDLRYRYSADGHLDLMDFLSDYGGTKPAKMDAIAKLCGMPGKVGVSGSDVAGLVAAGKLNEVHDYCMCDVAQEGGIFLRTELLRGAITLDQYRAAMVSLVARINADARLKPVAEAMNQARLTLTE